jgi:hypothetical protein
VKKLPVLISALFLILTACGGNDDDNNIPPVVTQSFNFDGQTYSLLGTQGITEGKMEDAFNIDGTQYDRSTITLIGLQGFTKTGTVSFDLYYKHGMTVAGTYSIDDDIDEGNFDTYLGARDRACLGWISMASAFNNMSGVETSANNPSGTVTIVANSPTNYTIQYTGNFKVYENGFDFVRNAATVVNVTGEVYIQSN